MMASTKGWSKILEEGKTSLPQCALKMAEEDNAYKSRIHHLVLGYIRGLKLKWVIARDVCQICFEYVYEGKLFEYEEDYDQNGILWWLGTMHGKEEEWKNPAERGLIKLSSSRVGTASPC